MIKKHIAKLIDLMCEGLFEKHHIMSIALLSSIAGESMFLLGPPGTAKSMVARRLKIVFKHAKSFEYLMSRFSTPDEIFGPVSISKLKNEDKYERIVDGYLPDAEVVFLDEIWKAGPAIQNALLTAINERIYKNGTETLKLPLKVLVAASNELPEEEDGLEALWDRFLVRMVSNCITNENTFYEMVRSNSIENPVIDTEYMIDDEQFCNWSLAINKIDIPDEVCHIVTKIRKYLLEEQHKENVNPLDYYISDRRWKKIFHLMQTSAYLNGRNAIDISDCVLLFHCLWNNTTTIPMILNAVCSALTQDIDNAIAEKSKCLDNIISQFSASMPKDRKSTINSDTEYVIENHFYYLVDGFIKGRCLFAKLDYNHIDSIKQSDGVLYFDGNKQNWIIHAIYADAPFDYKFRNDKISKVKLKKCRGGIVVDGVPYSFKKRSLHNKSSELTIPNFSSYDILATEFDDLMIKYENLKKLFFEDNNLFVSSDDRTLINKQLNKTEAALKMLNVKIQNTRLLMS